MSITASHPPLSQDLPRAEQQVLRELIWRAGGKTYCWPSVGRLAADLSYSPRTVARALKRLGELGYITSMSRYRDGQRIASVRRLHLEPAERLMARAARAATQSVSGTEKRDLGALENGQFRLPFDATESTEAVNNPVDNPSTTEEFRYTLTDTVTPINKDLRSKIPVVNPVSRSRAPVPRSNPSEAGRLITAGPGTTSIPAPPETPPTTTAAAPDSNPPASPPAKPPAPPSGKPPSGNPPAPMRSPRSRANGRRLFRKVAALNIALHGRTAWYRSQWDWPTTLWVDWLNPLSATECDRALDAIRHDYRPPEHGIVGPSQFDALAKAEPWQARAGPGVTPRALGYLAQCRAILRGEKPE